MKVNYADGKIICEGLYFEDVCFDVANNKIAVCFNGKGAAKKFSVMGDKIYYDNVYSWLKLSVDGQPLGANTRKKVELIGRTQTITIENEVLTVTIKQFLTPDAPCVYERVKIEPKRRIHLEMALAMPAEISENTLGADKNVCYKSTNGFCLKANTDFYAVPEVKAIIHEDDLDTATVFDLVYGYNDTILNAEHDIDAAEMQASNEIHSVVLPSSVQSEKDKAIYYAAYFCSLENYKELGEFNAFAAGCNYVSPIRTYYRDSYYTILPMYNGHTDKIRNQILTLAKGISEDGTCPSAVINNFKPWWGQHYDSPSMYCIMIYDYVNNTGDTSILSEVVNGKTILEHAKQIIDKLSHECDNTHLVVKTGKYNQRDWADEVNRYGYVTYIEVFYARALYCMSKLMAKVDGDAAKRYETEYLTVKDSINSLLWDDEKGYYVNFTNEDYTESNLSVDTIFAVIFGIAEGERAQRMLDACQSILESRNNPDVLDFGILCVYPIYSHMHSARGKSSRPLDYHNGSEWPYWSAMYAYALKMYGRDYHYALTRWFDYNIERGNYTPVEYHSPYCITGSNLQAWSGAAAFVFNDVNCDFYKNKL